MAFANIMKSFFSPKTFVTIVGFIAVIAIINFLISPKDEAAKNTSSNETVSTTESAGDSLENNEASETPIDISKITYETTNIKAPKGTIKAMLADDDTKQELGLGMRENLAADSGMLFPFAEPGEYSFWMKDMKFPIDIIWINESKKVVTINENVSPDTYPDTFSPDEAVSYVLELNAGAAKKFGINKGSTLSF